MPDLALAGGLAAGVVSYLAASGTLTARYWTAPLVVVLCCAALAGRSRWPVAGSVTCTVVFVAARLFGQAQALEGPPEILLAVAFLISYTLGSQCRPLAGLSGVTLLIAGLQATSDTFNPFFEIITFGPWIAGRVALSKRRLVEQLELSNAQMLAERDAFTAESVRYERARIGRELHDIVAHCVSVMVVQASAGQRLVNVDPVAAGEAFGSISQAAEQANEELGRLVRLLADQTPRQYAPGLGRVDELVRRAQAAGLAVTYRYVGCGDRHGPAAPEAVYRVVQESLTNALKHAPGASVHITLRETSGRDIEVEVLNDAPPQQASSGLEHSGGGRGLAGMRERVTACGGRLSSGVTPNGGWRVLAVIPEGSG